tara:strand:+ start:110 stop:622 length:513 start_codon:yes stop_codon:yes gene_type:complete
MIKNKIYFFTILIFLTQCGYQTIYSNKNLDFSIAEIKIINDQNIGRQIKNRLGLLSSNIKADNFNLEIDSKFEKTTTSKDKQGNPNIFNLIVYVKVNIISDSSIEQSKVFSESINYNNSENKFNLKRYEDSLKENLTEKIIENLLLYLQSISLNKSNASLQGNIGYTVKK